MANSKLFELFQQIFLLSGLWDVTEWKSMSQYLFKIYSQIVLLATVCETISVFYFLIVTATNGNIDWNVMFVYIAAFITCLLIVIKSILCRRKRFLTYLKNVFLDESILNSTTDLEIIVMSDKMKKNMLLVVRSYSTVVIGILVIIIIGAILFFTGHGKCIRYFNDCERKLMLRSVVPFDVPKQYILAFIYQVMITTCTVFTLIATDNVILAPIIHFISEIRSLRHSLKHICPNADATIISEEYSEQSTVRKIRSCIKRHQELLRELVDFQEHTATVFLFDFLLRSSQLAAIIYFLMNRDDIDYFSMLWILIFAYYTSQLFLTYLFAQILTEEYSNLSNTIYETNWYNLETKSRKLLLLMMMRSQKTLALKVGAFGDVNLDVLLKIFKTVYSFITVFRSRM